MKATLGVLCIVVGLVVVGCGGGDSKDGDTKQGEATDMPNDGVGGGASSPDGEGTDAELTDVSDDVSQQCREGCEATVAAACPIGPPDQESCEQDCRRLAEGECAEEYEMFQSCADGEVVTCGSIGIPVVEACSLEQEAFISCLQ